MSISSKASLPTSMPRPFQSNQGASSSATARPGQRVKFGKACTRARASSVDSDDKPPPKSPPRVKPSDIFPRGTPRTRPARWTPLQYPLFDLGLEYDRLVSTTEYNMKKHKIKRRKGEPRRKSTTKAASRGTATPKPRKASTLNEQDGNKVTKPKGPLTTAQKELRKAMKNRR